ncbi:MAG: EamA family transporter [Bryobacteraceae bacterium]|nr:EamA family transporter [Bryobacteraceae bacterium]
MSFLLVVVASFIGSFGAVFLKAGSKNLKSNLRSLLTNYKLAIGGILFVVSSLFFVKAISQPGAELSVLYPMVSMSYLWAMIWSRLFFQEPFTRQKFAGLGLIILGIAILQFGKQA